MGVSSPAWGADFSGWSGYTVDDTYRKVFTLPDDGSEWNCMTYEGHKRDCKLPIKKKKVLLLCSHSKDSSGTCPCEGWFLDYYGDENAQKYEHKCVFQNFWGNPYIPKNGSGGNFSCNFFIDEGFLLASSTVITQVSCPEPIIPNPTISLSSSPSPMSNPILYGKEQEPVEVKTLMSNSSGKLSNVVYSDNANVAPIVSSGTVLASGNWVAVSKFEPSVA